MTTSVPKIPKLHLLLFLLTIFTTYAVQGSLAYTTALIAILLFHEMGHYVAARYYEVPASLPYFIPFPNLFGTFGAVIKMQGRIPHRKALFDIGIMGPFLGVVVAIPAAFIGIMLSDVVDLSTLDPNVRSVSLGDSLLFSFFSHVIHGDVPEGFDLRLHPLGFAGWAGLLVTAINLLPIGQLDGGHVIYALFGKKSQVIYKIIFTAFCIFAFVYNKQWLFFAVLVLFLTRLQHPPTIDDRAPIGKRRFMYGILALVFFILTFPPNPIKF